MLSKHEITEMFLYRFGEKLGITQALLEDIRNRARDAPGSNTSHSDTTKFQLSNEALALDGQVQEIQQSIVFLRQLTISVADKIRVGALVVLRDMGSNDRKTYLFVAKGGGEKVKCADCEITSIAISAPLAKVCIGKEEGEEVAFNGKKYEIESLQ